MTGEHITKPLHASIETTFLTASAVLKEYQPLRAEVTDLVESTYITQPWKKPDPTKHRMKFWEIIIYLKTVTTKFSCCRLYSTLVKYNSIIVIFHISPNNIFLF